jgi:hypothetical protein
MVSLGAELKEGEPREVTPHIETGAQELLAREAMHSFYTLL